IAWRDMGVMKLRDVAGTERSAAREATIHSRGEPTAVTSRIVEPERIAFRIGRLAQLADLAERRFRERHGILVGTIGLGHRIGESDVCLNNPLTNQCAKRLRSWGAAKSIAAPVGPSGTMPVGFTRFWLP